MPLVEYTCKRLRPDNKTPHWVSHPLALAGMFLTTSLAGVFLGSSWGVSDKSGGENELKSGDTKFPFLNDTFCQQFNMAIPLLEGDDNLSFEKQHFMILVFFFNLYF